MMPAAAIRFFDGKHPRFTQVPPSVRFSVIATVLPSSAALIAAANAVEPEPRITKSNRGISISCKPSKSIDDRPGPPGGQLGQAQPHLASSCHTGAAIVRVNAAFALALAPIAAPDHLWSVSQAGPTDESDQPEQVPCVVSKR